MKKLFALALCVVSFAAAAQMNQPYWWGLGVGDTKFEVDLNNVREMTYAVRVAPMRITMSGSMFMRELTVNCVTKESLKPAGWKPASQFDMTICNKK